MSFQALNITNVLIFLSYVLVKDLPDCEKCRVMKLGSKSNITIYTRTCKIYNIYTIMILAKCGQTGKILYSVTF
jgi:hypothetical protein